MSYAEAMRRRLDTQNLQITTQVVLEKDSIRWEDAQATLTQVNTFKH